MKLVVSTRESTPVRMAGYLIASWGLVFALVCAVLGNIATSRQWQYLMSVPAGKWAWATVFGICALLALFGLARRKHRFIMIGLTGIGGFCLLIAVFYLFAPAFIENMITLGWLPWMLCAGSGIGVGAMNRNSREW